MGAVNKASSEKHMERDELLTLARETVSGLHPASFTRKLLTGLVAEVERLQAELNVQQVRDETLSRCPFVCDR